MRSSACIGCSNYIRVLKLFLFFVIGKEVKKMNNINGQKNLSSSLQAKKNYNLLMISNF
jgi:hypothetical protein